MTALTANGRHARWRELAATALDFPLSAGEAADLGAHLASCPACARLADNLRLDATALGRPARVPTSYRLDSAIVAAVAGRERRPSASRALLLVAATALLLVAILGAAAVGAFLWRTLQPLLVVDPSPMPPAVIVDPGTQGPFDAVFIRSPADGDVTALSTIVAVRADGTERVLATVPGVEMSGAPWMAISEAGHLALLLRDGDQVGWAVLDTNVPGSQPIPVALPGRDDTDRGYAVWGPGERLAIVLSPSSDDQAVAFVDPTTGQATVHPVPISQHNCFANRCGAWAADGSGFVLGPGVAATPLAILHAGGDVAPFAARVQPSSMGTRDVNASGDVLLGGTKPWDVPGPANTSDCALENLIAAWRTMSKLGEMLRNVRIAVPFTRHTLNDLDHFF